MKRTIIVYFTTLILIPVFVVSVVYNSLKQEQNNIEINTQNVSVEKEIKKETIELEKEEPKEKTIEIKTEEDKEQPNLDANYKVRINKNNNVSELDLEEYIIGVVAGEMPASFNTEALKAQAVASRTYAVYKMGLNKDTTLKTNTDDQVYITVDEMKQKWESSFDTYYNKIKEAVESTKNLVMKKNNEVFKSYYFAMSNGYTEDSIAVFSDNTSSSVSSPWDNETLNNFKVTKEFKKSELKTKLNMNEDITSIKILSRDKTNRVEKLTVNNKTFTGIEFRKLLTLRSTDFEIEDNGSSYLITTKGYGHGVGMSQYGANGMAEDNYKYNEILKYYYQNIEITTI